MNLHASQILLVSMVIGLCESVCCANQPKASRPPQATAPASGAVELSNRMNILDEVGLSMQIPGKSALETTMIGEVRTPQIVPADGKWICNIQTPKTSTGNTTLKQAAETTISLIQGSVGVTDPEQKALYEKSSKATVIDRSANLVINDQPAERFYMAVPSADGKPLIKGYTIFKPFGNQFVVFELICPEPNFNEARIQYETALATARFEDPVVINLQRGQAIRAGQELLKSVSDADLAALCDGKEYWYRLYRPASTASKSDAEEFGYRGIRFWKGQRGEVDRGDSRGSWTRADRQKGFLASIRARLLTPQGPADSEAIYFLSEDRTEEAWIVRMVIRDGKTGRDLVSAKETGARADRSLSIVIDQPGQPSRTVSPFFQSQGYVSQIEAMLLPRLIVLKQLEKDMAFYAYQSQLESVSLRRDSVKRVATGDKVLWSIETTHAQDAPTQTSTYSASGELIRTSTGDGRVWEPMNVEKIKELWESKGLPVTTAPKK